MRTCLAAAVAALVGCGAVEPRGCDLCTTSAVVDGQLRDASGQPVAGASVEIAAFRDSCSGPPHHVFRAETGSPGPLTTDASGRFRTRLRSSYSPVMVCLEVVAMAGSGAGAVHGSARTMVRFDADYPEPSAQQIHVDVVVRDGL